MNRTELQQLLEKSEALKSELESILRSSDMGVEMQGTIHSLSSALEKFRFDSSKLNESWISMEHLKTLLEKAQEASEFEPYISYARDAEAKDGVISGVVSNSLALSDSAEVVSEAKFQYPVGRVEELEITSHETYLAGMSVDDGVIGNDVDGDLVADLIAQSLPALVDLQQVVVSADSARAPDMTLLAEKVVSSGDIELASQFESQFGIGAKEIIYGDVSPLSYALKAQEFLRSKEFAEQVASKVDVVAEKANSRSEGVDPSPGF